MAESNGKAHHYKSRFYSFEQYVEVYHILNHLQDYFDEHLQKPNRVPKNLRDDEKRYLSPFTEEKGNSIGNLKIYDPIKREKWRGGQRLEMYFDKLTHQSGDLVYYVQQTKNFRSRQGAIGYLKKLYGPTPNYTKEELEQIRERYFLRFEKSWDKDKPKNMQTQLKVNKEEERAAWALRRQTEEDTLQHLLSSHASLIAGDDMEKLPPEPIVMSRDQHTGQMKETPLTGINYLLATGKYQNDDPRYYSKSAIKQAGYKLKADAVPYPLEYGVANNYTTLEQLKVVSYYNAKDIIGPPPYKDHVKTQEEIEYNVKDVLKANGWIDEKTKDPDDYQKNLERLRTMCDNVVWPAEVLGEQKLQSELLYARILHQCGDRTIQQTAYSDAIEAHLRRDLNEKNIECRQDDPQKGFYQVSKNLAQCAIGMDKALKTVNENLDRAHAHENAKERQQQKEDALHPFRTLEVRIDRDIFDANGKLERPKGIVLKGDKAYKQLADLVVADRREFAHYRDRGYGRKVDVTVSFKGKEYPVHLENGRLLGGNAQSVANLLENCMTRQAREQAYNDSVRRRELAERTKKQLFEDKDNEKLVKQYQETKGKQYKDPKWRTKQHTAKSELSNEVRRIQEVETRKLDEEYRRARIEAKASLKGFREGEETHLRSNPAIKRNLERFTADTYRYLLPETKQTEKGESLITQRDILHAYGSDNVLSIHDAGTYLGGKGDDGKPLTGTVIETRTPLTMDSDGFWDPTRAETAAIKAKPYQLGIEKSRVMGLEEHLSVTIERDVRDLHEDVGLGPVYKREKEVLKGEEARLALGDLMLQDRDAFDAQQEKGTRSLDDAMHPIHVTVTYRNETLMDEAVYPGRLQIGNNYTPGQMLASRNWEDPKHRNLALEVGSAFHSATKYAPDDSIDMALDMYKTKDREEVQKAVDREMRPKGMEHLAPRVGQTAENEMAYYKAQAQVNYRTSPEEQAEYIVEKLVKKPTKMNLETIQKRFDDYQPELSETCRKYLARSDVQRTIQDIQAGKLVRMKHAEQSELRKTEPRKDVPKEKEVQKEPAPEKAPAKRHYIKVRRPSGKEKDRGR
jgi:hypothetical protein